MTAGNLVCGFLAIMTIIDAISKGGIDNLDESRELFEKQYGLFLPDAFLMFLTVGLPD